METIVGAGPDEGIRADVRMIREKLEKIERTVTKHLYLAVGGGAVILWGLNALTGHT